MGWGGGSSDLHESSVVVMGTTGIKDTHTAPLYKLAFTATRSVSARVVTCARPMLRS